MTNSISVNAPATGTVNVALAISGTVSPAPDIVSLQLAQQNITLPTGAWTSATTQNGTFAGTLVPPASGNWYVWAWDQATGLSSVSDAVAVPNPALTLVPAVPIPNSQVAVLIAGPLEGETMRAQAAEAVNAKAAAAASTEAGSASSVAGTAQETADGAIPLASPAVQFPLSNMSVIPASYSVPENHNAVSFGPIVTIADGAVLTVPSTSVWRII